jgi:outer membrane protein TolC
MSQRSTRRSPAAKEQRPELRQSTEQVRAARLTVEAARARLLPSVSFDFEGDMSGNKANDLQWSRRVAANLGAPLFDRSRKRRPGFSARVVL